MRKFRHFLYHKIDLFNRRKKKRIKIFTFFPRPPKPRRKTNFRRFSNRQLLQVPVIFFSFLSMLWFSQSDHHPESNLAKVGYKLDTKVSKNLNLCFKIWQIWGHFLSMKNPLHRLEFTAFFFFLAKFDLFPTKKLGISSWKFN